MVSPFDNMNNVKYECVVCDERGFSSRADWLFHLVLERHSLKAQENKQELYLQSGGKWLVVSEIGYLESGLILEYVADADRLPSFSNFFTLRPQANLCIVVCSEGCDFEWFTLVPHIIGGIQPNFRDYNEIPLTAWNSYFIENRTDPPQVKVKKEPASNYQEEYPSSCS